MLRVIHLMQRRSVKQSQGIVGSVTGCIGFATVHDESCLFVCAVRTPIQLYRSVCSRLYLHTGSFDQKVSSFHKKSKGFPQFALFGGAGIGLTTLRLPYRPASMQNSLETIPQKQDPLPGFWVKADPHLGSSKLLYIDLQHAKRTPATSPL